MPIPSHEDAASVFFAFARVIRGAIQATSPDTCSFLHVKTLTYIKEHGEPTMRDIAGELRVTSPAVTAIIDRLVETGDLERVTDTTDRRVIKLKLTKTGKATLERGLKAIHDNVRDKLSVLSTREQHDLLVILRKIINNHTN